MKKLVIIGAGGLGREVAQYVKDINLKHPTYELLGFIDDDPLQKGKVYNGDRVLGNITLLKEMQGIYAFCAIANPSIKKKIHQQLKEYNCKFINIIHPTAYISSNVKLGKNVLVAPNCVLTTNITIEDFVLINPQCGIGHDTNIGEYTTLYWNVNTGGFVKVGKSVQLGTQTFIKQGLEIGNDVISGAGAVIVKDIEEGRTVKGVPAL